MPTLTEPWIVRWPPVGRTRRDGGAARGRPAGEAGCRSPGSASARGRLAGTIDVDPHELPDEAWSEGCPWPDTATVEVLRDVAVRLLRGEPPHEVGVLHETVGFFVVRAAAPTPPRPCSSSRPTRGTPTTTSAGATSTPAAPQCRSPGRWPPATCASPRAPATGWPSSTHPTSACGARHLPPRAPDVPVGGRGLAQRRAAVRAVGRGGRLRPRLRRQRRLEWCRGCSTTARPTSPSATTSTGRGHARHASRTSSAAGGNAAFLSGNTGIWQVRHEEVDVAHST